MKQKEIDDLIRLNPVNFNYREWILLKYVREWGLSKGKSPLKKNHEDYYLQYSRKERAYILKTMRVMLLSNLLNNFIKEKGWRSDIEGSDPDDFTHIGKRSDIFSKSK